jgi:hypothetical protein
MTANKITADCLGSQELGAIKNWQLQIVVDGSKTTHLDL